MGTERPHLRRLADRCGILTEYVDIRERRKRVTSDETREALLHAMGFDATSEKGAADALASWDREEASRLLPPVQVVPSTNLPRSLAARAPEGLPRSGTEWSLEWRDASCEEHVVCGCSQSDRNRLRIPFPVSPEVGYHRVNLTIETPTGARSAEQFFIVTPSSCPDPRDRVGPDGGFGICANLYTVRSATNWGVGNLTDLGRLLEWCGEVGGDFVGVNPLQATRNRGHEISPYSPITRLFPNPLYLDLEAVPEFEGLTARERARVERFRADPRVNYEGVSGLQLEVLRRMFSEFRDRQILKSHRSEEYLDFCARRLLFLEDFATFLTLEESDLPREKYPEVHSEAACDFRSEHLDRVLFHYYVQFELDRQLGRAAEKGRASGLRVGLYQDMPLGTVPDGFDAWAFPHLFATGASLGAPPDPFNPEGQNWGLQPFLPHGLREDRYQYWAHLLESVFRHSGAVRIDHVMGLFRQFWIPEGLPPTAGAYVQFPAGELLGILALEATRRDALVVGEDLGTCPPDLRRALAKWRILSSKVLYFERERRGTFRAAGRYPYRALTTVNTHDLPTLRAFLGGKDLIERERAGLIRQPDELILAKAERERDTRALRRRLIREGVLEDGDTTGPNAERKICRAVHTFLCRTPSALVGISLDDLAGETSSVNLPGVDLSTYPSWSRKLRPTLEQLREDPDVRFLLTGCESRRRPTRKKPHDL